MEIIISPIHKTFFTGRIWSGLDIDRIAAILIDTYGHNVTIIDFAEVASDYTLIPHKACWFYTPSYDERYNRYIRDVITDFDRSRKDVVLIPDVDILFSFENKGYQELYKRRLDIEYVRGRYLGDQGELISDKVFDYPFVHKKINGSVSSGVRLVRSRKEFESLRKKETRRTLIEKIRYYRRRFKIMGMRSDNKLINSNFTRFFTQRAPFVIQEFIPNIDHDYKVLIFGEKYYVLKRWVRPNDFRASGSGIIEKVIPPSGLLDYSAQISQKLDTPFCALDIAFTGKQFVLIEFQGVGFGPSTLTDSSFYFTRIADGWKKVESVSSLEEEYANAIHSFLLKCL